MDMIDAFTMNQVIERNAELVKQRAELLEALKEIITSVDKGQCVMLDKARQAITKAEATE